ncbi:MAG TPA: acyl carrier protein [Actinomycetota bacterium]|nr:acyl carrier protein [Actinomycetota bacterium]
MAIRTLESIEETLKEYVLAEASRRGVPLEDIGRDEDFMERHLFDSLSLLDFVLYLEQVAGVKIPGEDVVPENLGSLGAITRYLGETFELR